MTGVVVLSRGKARETKPSPSLQIFRLNIPLSLEKRKKNDKSDV
jgi:hypothetical protein